MVAFFNGEAEPHVRMEAAWTIIMASRAFDAPATDTVLIEHSGAGLEGPVAFLRTGLLLCYDAATDRWNLIAVVSAQTVGGAGTTSQEVPNRRVAARWVTRLARLGIWPAPETRSER